MVCSNQRVFKALARDGIAATKEGPVYRVRLVGKSTEASAEILLPDSLPLESKAVRQLVAFASVRHPAGGEVRAAFATPDFHPGSIVPVGAVVATTRDMVIPQAIGNNGLTAIAHRDIIGSDFVREAGCKHVRGWG